MLNTQAERRGLEVTGARVVQAQSSQWRRGSLRLHYGIPRKAAAGGSVRTVFLVTLTVGRGWRRVQNLLAAGRTCGHQPDWTPKHAVASRTQLDA